LPLGELLRQAGELFRGGAGGRHLLRRLLARTRRLLPGLRRLLRLAGRSLATRLVRLTGEIGGLLRGGGFGALLTCGIECEPRRLAGDLLLPRWRLLHRRLLLTGLLLTGLLLTGGVLLRVHAGEL